MTPTPQESNLVNSSRLSGRVNYKSHEAQTLKVSARVGRQPERMCHIYYLNPKTPQVPGRVAYQYVAVCCSVLQRVAVCYKM